MFGLSPTAVLLKSTTRSLFILFFLVLCGVGVGRAKDSRLFVPVLLGTNVLYLY